MYPESNICFTAVISLNIYFTVTFIIFMCFTVLNTRITVKSKHEQSATHRVRMAQEAF